MKDAGIVEYNYLKMREYVIIVENVTNVKSKE